MNIRMMLRRQSLIVTIVFGLIMLLYIVAVFSTFVPRSVGSNYGELVVSVLTVIGGLTVFIL